jgi:PAS domain S-box-containing protein
VFQWPTLVDQNLVKQMGFFRYYPEWEWIIGTTAQIDSIEKDSHNKLGLIVKKLEKIFLNMKFAKTGHIFLFTGNGEMLIHPEISGENIADDVFMQKLMAASESPEKPFEYSFAIGEEHEQRHLTYMKYFKALDWYVAASISHNAAVVSARRLAIRQMYIMLTILLGGILIASILSKKIAQPLETLSQYAKGLPEKDLTVEKIHLPIKLRTTNREINQLAESFAFMETQVGEHLKELNKYRAHLEELVKARTSELTHMNQQLQQEIIERKQIEEKLIKFEREKSTILNAMSEMFAYYYDENLVIQWANKASGDSVGMAAEELVGQYCYKIWQQRSEPCERCPVIKAFETGKTQEMEVTTTDGRIWFIRGCPIFNEADEIVGAVEITQNITERKRVEEQIKNQNILLEQAVQEKQQEMEALFERLIRQEKLATIGQIAGSIAHELRNPLGAVKQSAFFLERLYQRHQLDASNPKVKEHLDLIETELDISGRVISDLLQMTRMKLLQREQTNLRPIIEDAANHCHFPESIQLTIDLPTEPFLIQVDSLQLRQVFINLLTNAVQSIEENGHITISAKQLTGERSCVIEIEDNGIGIEPDLLNRVFEPLYTTKATGTGLGLSICKQIIENHQGQISVKSRKDQGTIVTIVLPE